MQAWKADLHKWRRCCRQDCQSSDNWQDNHKCPMHLKSGRHHQQTSASNHRRYWQRETNDKQSVIQSI